MNSDSPPHGITSGVLVAAMLAVPAAFVFLLGFTGDTVPGATAYVSGWLAFAFPAALLLDHDPRSRLGWALAVIPLVPVAVGTLAWFWFRHIPDWHEFAIAWDRAGVIPVLIALAAIGAAIGYAPDRVSVRRFIWFTLLASLVVITEVAAWIAASPETAGVVTMLGLWTMAGASAVLGTATGLRPIDEPLIDALLLGAALALGAGAGLAMQAIGDRFTFPAFEESATFAAVATATLSLPGVLWLRRQFLERRYGTGRLTPDDVASITADLHQQTDARELLGKAATMVAKASGHRSVRIDLDADHRALPNWKIHPLVVGGDRVGTLLFNPLHREGPEPRQALVIDQLLPTVALVAKAVSLAVQAEHAKQEVIRERESERTRILSELHDGLGPVLAGMSMKVQARLRNEPSPWLQALATDLRDSRGDLRKIVSGLTPSALHEGNLASALNRLAESFREAGADIALNNSIDAAVPEPVAVAVYRTIAEGITNTLRHAHAQHVSVTVRTVDENTADPRIVVDIIDDGIGGTITPGVGLTSLRGRAAELGGAFTITADNQGARLHLDLPLGAIE